MPSTSDSLATALGVVVKHLDRHQMLAAAADIRAIPADGVDVKFFASLAESLERGADTRVGSSLHQGPLE